MAQNPDHWYWPEIIQREISLVKPYSMVFHRINLNLFPIMIISLLYFKKSIYFDLISMS